VPKGRPTPLQALRSGEATAEDFRRWPPIDMGSTLRQLLEPVEADD